ncbi:DUF6351 family protein [Streptomyces sp. ISL-10]|uniref:DUF6351 family protein n=1 Tax=Streptomyces sp. ISL-10 TaxID=2819172 RepID=UPI0035ABEDD1
MDGLQLGASHVSASVGRGRAEQAQLTVINHPRSGPVISGSHEESYACTTGFGSGSWTAPPSERRSTRIARRRRVVTYAYANATGDIKHRDPAPGIPASRPTRHTAHGTRHTAHGTRHTANTTEGRQVPSWSGSRRE